MKKDPRDVSALSVTLLAGVSGKESKLWKEDFCIYFGIFFLMATGDRKLTFLQFGFFCTNKGWTWKEEKENNVKFYGPVWGCILQALCSLDCIVIICCILFNTVWQAWLDDIAGHYLRWEIG